MDAAAGADVIHLQTQLANRDARINRLNEAVEELESDLEDTTSELEEAYDDLNVEEARNDSLRSDNDRLYRELDIHRRRERAARRTTREQQNLEPWGWATRREAARRRNTDRLAEQRAARARALAQLRAYRQARKEKE
jgi:hypothetical protein